MRLRIIFLATFLFVAIGNSKAFSQEGTGKVYCKITFVAEDALGNTDTVVFSIVEKVDGSQEPENLYGVEPQGDLDMRIIQRTKKLCIEASPENKDFKEDVRCNGHHLQDFIVQVYAKNYPVQISIVEWTRKWHHCQGCEHTLYIGACDSITGVHNYNNCICNEGYLFFNYFWITSETKENDVTYYLIKKDKPYVVCKMSDSSQNDLLVFEYLYLCYADIVDGDIAIRTVYPNPSSGFITIEEVDIGEEFELVDISGKLIKSFVVENYPYRLDISELKKGNYFLRNKDGGKVIHKFIKE